MAGLIVAVLSLILTATGVWIAYSQLKGPLSKQEENQLLNKIRDRKIIKIGYFHYPPFILKTANEAEPKGFYAEIFKHIGQANDLRIVWIAMTPCESIQAVVKKKVDIFISIFQTSKRTSQVDFTAFMHAVTVSGVTKKSNNTFHSQADLTNSNTTIVVSRDDIGDEFVESAKIGRQRLTIIETDDVTKIIHFVESGHVDVAVLDSVSIFNYLEKFGKTILQPIFTNFPIAICLNGIMLPHHEHDLMHWLDHQCKSARLLKPIEQLEINFLKKYHGLITRR